MTGIVKAQADSVQKKQDKPSFKLGIFYNSYLNYYGRTNNVKNAGFFPLAEFWLDKNFYINAAPVFIFNKTTRLEYAGTVATAGYKFTSTNNKVSGNFYVVKPFYKENTSLVQSALKAQGAGSLTVLNKILNFTAGGDIKFSSKTDYGVNAGIDHIFRQEFPGKYILVIDPSAYVYAGTQQFNKTYYEDVLGTELLAPQQNVNKFSILSYEFSVPVIFVKGKWQLIAVPAYVLPQNIYSVPDRPDLAESGDNLFYITAGIKVNF
jgi:hypothetical protein